MTNLSNDLYMENYRERYKRIGESEWFKEHYEGKSLGEVIDEIIDNAEPMPGEFRELVEKNFWDLAEGTEKPITSQAVDDNFFDALEDGWHLWPDEKPESLPNIFEGEWMLVYYLIDQGTYYGVAKYTNGKWIGQGGEEYYSDDVMYWMPFKNV